MSGPTPCFGANLVLTIDGYSHDNKMQCLPYGSDIIAILRNGLRVTPNQKLFAQMTFGGINLVATTAIDELILLRRRVRSPVKGAEKDLCRSLFGFESIYMQCFWHIDEVEGDY